MLETRRSMQSAVLALLLAPTVYASQVCSPTSCLSGVSHSPLLAVDHASHIYLTPGSYTSENSVRLTSLSLTSSFDASLSASPDKLVVYPPPYPLSFSSDHYAGATAVWTAESWRSAAWKSIYLPEGWYGVISPGLVIWGAIPDASQLPAAVIRPSLVRAASSRCSPPCSSNGICAPSAANSSSATCTCSTGWTGPACDTCEKGYWGATCSSCPSSCLVCDDGILGSGVCLGTNTTSSRTCKCLHGTCTMSGECVCASGYVSNTTASDQKCSICAEGFFKDAEENCSVCPLGCSACQLKDSTNATATCTYCAESLELSTTDPATCTASGGSCAAGQFWDLGTSLCQNCSPACSTCTGPSTNQCLACASPRANLAGSCVGYETSTGVCDSSLSKLQGVFVFNNGKAECDACPVGCLACSIPSFSSVAAYSSLKCHACQEGYLLQSGRCVRTCSKGYFLPIGSAVTNGTCEACDSTCSACVGTATTCTRCSTSDLVASNGSCIQTCPSGTINSNGTCHTCSTDCAICSNPGSTSSCLSCPPSRPILSDGQCLEYCPPSSYFDTGNATCKTCDPTCGSCVGPRSTQCTTCPDHSVLKAGSCVAATCGKGGYISGLGLCLSDLVPSSRAQWAGFAAVPIVLILLGAGRWYIRREHRKTRKATQEFAEVLDERTLRDRMMTLRLERILGINRVAVPQPSTSRTEGDRRRFRDRLLPSRRRAENIPLDERKIDQFGDDRPESYRTAPPPPYMRSGEAPSMSLVESPDCQTKIVSMSSPTSPDYMPRALYPPPRPKVGVEKGIVRDGGLRELWPAMGSSSLIRPSHGDEGNGRMQHKWV